MMGYGQFSPFPDSFEYLDDIITEFEFLEGDLGTKRDRLRALRFLVKQAEGIKDTKVRKRILQQKMKFLYPRVSKDEILDTFFKLWEYIEKTKLN